MRSIDMATWPRRNHFRLVKGFDHPHVNVSVNVDVSAFSTIREAQWPLAHRIDGVPQRSDGEWHPGIQAAHSW
jgi:hypothetical protein